jgi:arginine repressor
MDYHVTALERAFQMARSGQYPSVEDIRKQLRAEGFSSAQVTGRALSRQLKELILQAREAQEAGQAQEAGEAGAV